MPKAKRANSGSTKRVSKPSITKRRVKKKASGSSTLSESELEQNFFEFFKANGFFPKQQVLFHPTRQWRFDFAWPDHKVAIEIQGFGKGHNSYAGMSSDYEKHNAAMLLGWKILYFMGHDLDPYRRANTISTIRGMFP